MASAARSAHPTVDRKPTTRVPSGKSKSKPTKEPKPQRKRARRANVKTEDTSDVEMTAPTCSTQLKVLATLPIEVFMHIAKYLRPLELLLFSRMNKSLRGILMSRRAAPAWRSAELNLPRLPPCPSSLCEPQYAALLFLRECSTCGRTTSRDVDCLRLVRLCDVCRRHQAVDIDRLAASGVAFTSTTPIQLKRVHKCFLTDVDVVSIEKLTKLSDGQDAKAFWTAHGLEDIRQREKFALVLRGWIEGYDRIQKAEEDSIRKAKATIIKEKRQKDIESRLLDLGWERQDFFSNLNKLWSDLLPDLLRILKQNRTRRLKQEKEIRRNQRDAMIKTWFRDIREETGLFAKAIPHGDSLGLVHPESFCWSSAKTTRTLSLQALPSADNFNQLIHLKYLAETDMSVDELKVQLSKQRKAFTDSVMEWQKHLENALLEVLPANTPTPGYAETSGFSLMAIGHYMLPFSKLSTRLQRLLRADSTFTSRSGGISFYPDDYAEWTPAKSPVKYHEKASKVAKGLLNALDRPNASYLELKALGAAFQCGVCHGQPVYMTWESLIQHYLDQEARWKLNSRSFGLRGNDIPFVCTHDVDRTNSAKPLVYIVAGSDREDSVSRIHKNSKCAICARIGISELVHSDYIADHVRDVHLIDKPKEGTHYQLALRTN